MSMIPAVFQSRENFSQCFSEGLQGLLAEQDLGAWILVLANAAMHPRLYKMLEAELHTRFDDLQDYLQEKASVQILPEDDLAVFQYLQQRGLYGLDEVLFTQRQIWQIQYNPIRALRPARASGEVTHQVYPAAFDPDKFNFNKAFLRKETLWSGLLQGRKIDVLYNKFPFVTWHALLVPERQKNQAQWLQQEMHEYIWELCLQLENHLPGLGMAYNASGANASVNHLHFQLFIDSRLLPVEDPCWLHNACDSYKGSKQDYPLACQVFNDVLQAFAFIQDLHNRNISYNLLYRPAKVYILARKKQGHYQPAEWAGSYAWYESCGGVVLSAREAFASLKADKLKKELAKLYQEI